MIKNLIKGGKQSAPADDSGSTLRAPCNFLGQNRNVKQISPYGLYGSPVKGSNWIIFSSRANSDDLHGIGNDYKNRPKDLKEGEVVLQNLLTGAFIKLDALGNIEATTAGNINASGANISATAALNATITAPNIIASSATITATATAKITATAPEIDLNGYVKIVGGLEVDGIIYGTHAHSNGGNPPQNP